MLRVDVTIQKASKIPLLGVKTEPNPYIIMECEQSTYTSPIAKYTQNPIWNYHTLVQAKKKTSYIHFYIYNNNPNAVDELLAYGKAEFGQLMTRSNSLYKLRLMNSLEEPIQSFLFLEHYDAEPSDLYLPLSERTSITLRLINQIPPGFSFVCEYGESSFGLSQELNENAFRYSPKQDRIHCILRDKEGKPMDNELLISNIGRNNCMVLRFYGNRQDYAVFLATSINVNGLLPENYNILNAKVIDVTKSTGKKNSNYRVKLYGPLNQNTFNEKAQCEIYVENSSQFLIEYFEDTENVEGVESYCSFRVPVNSLNWSADTFDCTHQLKYYDSFKSIETVLNLKFSIRKSFELAKIVPKLNNTQNLFDSDSTLLLQQIKVQNCFLFEVIKDNAVLLFHADLNGTITAFNKFFITQNKTQYILQTKERLNDGGRGVMYLVNLDQQFTDKPSKDIESSLIFKIEIQQPNKFQQSKIQYGNKFLAFAKKASVVNICKKFNQMVHDDLLKLTVKSKYTGNIRKGILKIVNFKAIGSFGKVNTLIGVDSVNKYSSGQIGNYLLDKPYCFYVDEGNVKVQVKLEGVEGAGNNKDPKEKDKLEICYYGSFCDFFGTPNKQKLYTQELKISTTHKLQIIYAFQQGEKIIEPTISKLNDFIFLGARDNVFIRLKRAFVGVNNKSYKFRISRGTYSYQSQSYRSSNNKINFQTSQHMTLRMENGDEVNPIFISAYSHDQEDKLLIYNGFINTTDIIGKGEYQILLVHEKEEKRKEIFLILESNLSSLFTLADTSGTIKLSKIKANTTVPFFRNIYKHYLLVKVNSYQYDIYECSINEQSLTLNAVFNIRRGDYLILELYSSYKAISKQLFSSTEKELIGCGHGYWEQIEENGTFVLNYYPKKESQLKLTKNSLTLQEKSYKMFALYSANKTNLEVRAEGLRMKLPHIEIDVLNRGVVSLYLKEFYSLQMESKIVSVEIKPLGLQISSQSNYKINKFCIIRAQNMEFQLQASITTKQGQKYKRFTVSTNVRLRGHHFKINQSNSLVIQFQSYFYLTASFIILHNKFISIPQGNFLIKQISTRGIKIDRFNLTFTSQMDGEKNQGEILFKKQGPQAKNCDIAIKTNSEMNGLLFWLQGKGFKTKELICLSELNIDRYDQEFVYQRQILIGGQSLILTLKIVYSCVKQVKQQQLSVKYLFNNSKEVSIGYDPRTYHSITTSKPKSNLLNKTQGFLIEILLPNDLADGTKQVHLFPDGMDPIVLTPSVSNNNQYLFYSNKFLDVKNIKLINRDFLNKPIEPLGKQQGLWKFMVDQNPKLICSMAQTSCSISNIGNENWTFKFNFHRLLTLSKKRLLYLKNTPNDEILTRQLAVMLKHGSQYHIIRNLDEYGNMNEQVERGFEFGYDSSCNTFQVFLLIDNCFNQVSNKDFDKITQNWMELFPISYGSLNISNIVPDASFGFQLLPLQNHSINLQKAINRIVIRQDDIFCLCDMSFTKKNWGFITIKLTGCTSIIFSNKKEEDIFIYFKIEIEDSNRASISSFTSEAREVGKLENIEFTSNSLNMLFIQQSVESHYNLKITGYLLDNSNHYVFVEKRQEITDNLQKRGKQELHVQVKANQTNNFCKNTFQIGLEIWSNTKPKQKQSLVEKAKSINTVDALSFRDMNNIEFFQRLLSCQQLSHFNECLDEIKESYVYVEGPQYKSFILLIEYLSFNFDSSLIGEICEIIHLNLLKCPQIISDLQQENITQILYDYFKTICYRQRRKVPSKVVKVSNKQYLSAISKFKEDKTLKTLRQALELQMYLLYTPDQLLASLSFKNNEIILNIINLLLKHSKIIKTNLAKDMGEWIQQFGFTTENSEFQLFMLVLKNSILYGSDLSQQHLHRFIEILLQRIFPLPTVYEFWQQLKDRDQQFKFYQSILQNYVKQLEVKSVETCRGLKMMLNVLLLGKNHQLFEKLQKMHQPIIKILTINASKSLQITLLSSHFDLLAYLLDQKMVNQLTKSEIGAMIKSKIENIKDSSAKLILSNYTSKFSKSKSARIVNSDLKEGGGEEIGNKVGFYKKYLITSD